MVAKLAEYLEVTLPLFLMLTAQKMKFSIKDFFSFCSVALSEPFNGFV